MKRLFLYAMIFLLSPIPALAYLDPGSGSLLLSSLVALFASAVFFLKNVFYKFTHFASLASFSHLRGYGGGG